jgi:hypothetical protein
VGWLSELTLNVLVILAGLYGCRCMVVIETLIDISRMAIKVCWVAIDEPKVTKAIHRPSITQVFLVRNAMY